MRKDRSDKGPVFTKFKMHLTDEKITHHEIKEFTVSYGPKPKNNDV